jgi:hypothetical protein
MKRIIQLVFLCFFFCSCSHRIVRTGYVSKQIGANECLISIVKNQTFTDSIAIKLGEIKLGETGFSTQCNEEDALVILRKEACSLEADIINITDETRSDVWSSCYRCKAVFYKKSSPMIDIKSDITFQEPYLDQRVNSDKKRNRIIFTSSLISGFFIGIMQAQRNK